MEPAPRLFTIGHSNHPLDRFLALLKSNRIEVLVDARTRPYSRFAPHFNKNALTASLQQLGIAYLFLGQELGGRPEGSEFYDEAGHVLYHRIADSPLFHAGITRLEDEIGQHRIAVLCSEENPAVCHRHLLVGRVMAERGAIITHIRSDGRLQSDAEIIPPRGKERTLFEDATTQWRSPKPAPRKGKD